MTAISADWVLPVSGPPIRDGLVRFDDSRIVEVTTGRAGRHHAGAAIIPGFVNAHSHLEYSVYAGFGDGEAFGPWLRTHMLRKRALGPAEILAIARRGAWDSLASGITTTADYSFSGDAARAATELGLRAIVYLEVFAQKPADAERQYSEKRSGVTETGLVRIGISPHAPYTCSADVYAWCLSLGIPVGTHLAESASENAWLVDGSGPLAALSALLVPPTGKRSVGTLEELLGPDLLCAHCVDLQPAEIALLAGRGVPVAHCPRSNALLGCGIAPLHELRAAGVIVGLGTDSPASTPSFDMFDEARTAIMAARARERKPDALLAGDALQLATLDAAQALRLDGQVGTLEPGKRADLAIVSLAGSPYHPVEDPVAAVIFGGSPERVVETIVDGVTRYRSEDPGPTWLKAHSTASAARATMLAAQP